MKMTPYTRFDGIPTFRDSQIMELFDLMVSDGTDKVVFSDGFVTTRENFLAFSKTVTMFIVEEDGPIAVGWVNGVENNIGRAHFCFFSKVWGRADDIGKQFVSYVINVTGLDMLVGYTPSKNKRAVEFAIRCGSVLAGELPFGSIYEGRPCATSITYYVR